MADPPVIIAAAKYREQLAKQDAQALTRLGETYARIFKRLEDKIGLLIVDIGEKLPTQGQVVRMERYKALMAQTAEELQRFQGVLTEEMLRSVDLNIPLGELNARQLMSTTIAGNPSVAGQFNVLPKSAIESILGFLSPESPLYAKIQELAGFTADEVTKAIVEGVGLGYNPRKIAAQISNAYGQGLTNALRMTRTVQLYSYREASRASYIANGDVVDGWYWAARLDASTCISCISQHGSFHPNTETLNDHHNGRCAMIPAVKGFPAPLAMQGEEWFNKQSEADQIKQMGRGAYDAYKAGKFTFADISTTHKDDVYGEMRVAKPLKDLLGGGGSKSSPSPVAPPPLKPSGTPVSNALTMPSKGKNAEVYNNTLGIIDSVHGDGNLPQIPIKPNNSTAYSGKYRYNGATGAPVDIQISTKGQHLQTTLAHEVGHFIDSAALSSDPRKSAVTQDVMKGWLSAVKESAAYKTLVDARANPSAYKYEHTDRQGFKYSVTPDRKYLSYLTQGDELWARSYAQYIAEKSGNQEMIKQIQSGVSENVYGKTQWATDDFAPIKSEIDKMFTELGWMK